MSIFVHNVFLIFSIFVHVQFFKIVNFFNLASFEFDLILKDFSHDFSESDFSDFFMKVQNWALVFSKLSVEFCSNFHLLLKY